MNIQVLPHIIAVWYSSKRHKVAVSVGPFCHGTAYFLFLFTSKIKMGIIILWVFFTWASQWCGLAPTIVYLGLIHWHLNPMRTTCRLGKMRIWLYIEPITECVRKNSLICKFLMDCYQTCFMIGLTSAQIMILTNRIWC